MENQFGLAGRLLLDSVKPADTAPGISRDAGGSETVREPACALLSKLGYAETNSSTGAVTETSTNAVTLKNRLALLALASRFDQAFQLPMPHAPGAEFFGGMVSPRTFGHFGQNMQKIGVGGRGMCFRQAFESCVGEAAERLSFLEWDDDPLATTLEDGHGLTNSELQWALNGIGLSTETELGSLDWINAQSLVDSTTVRFPFEFAVRRPAARRAGKWQADSTGVGAGASRYDAILSAILEVIERDAIAAWWYGGRPGQIVETAFLTKSGFVDFANGVRHHSKRRWWLLNITTDVEVPVFACLSAQENGRAVVAGFSANPDVKQAMRGAFLEMCQMELAQELSIMKFEHGLVDNLQEQDHIWKRRNDELSVKNYPQLEGASAQDTFESGSVDDPVHTVVQQLLRKNLCPYLVNLSRLPIGIPVVRVVVPELQPNNTRQITERLTKVAKTNGTSLDKITDKLSPI